MSLADPSYVNITGPTRALLSDEYMSALQKATTDNWVLPLNVYGGVYNYTTKGQLPIDHGTSHFGVVDRYAFLIDSSNDTFLCIVKFEAIY